MQFLPSLAIMLFFILKSVPGTFTTKNVCPTETPAASEFAIVGIFTVFLANVTVAKNTVKIPTIANSDAAGVSVGHTFFVVNVPGTDFKIKNSIIASEGKNCIYSIKSDGNNVISDNSCFTPISGDKINTNPLLFPLEFNGGPTKTHRLAPTSPAKDAGNKYGCFDYLDKLLFQDQRGYFRPKMRCDSGAFEL